MAPIWDDLTDTLTSDDVEQRAQAHRLAELVAERLAITMPAGGEVPAELAGPCSAVLALVSRWCGLDGVSVASWPEDRREGAVMLAARLHRRRNSPAGVESFNELGPVYVSRRDPDVAMLLGLGEWATPRIG